jgi:hypothetical protein
MDEETRAGFDEMRRGFEEMRQGFAEMNRRFEAIDRRLDAIEERFSREIRENGVLIEDLRVQIRVVAEGGRINERAIERVRGEMHERFRENEIVVGGAFRQIRHDLDELRGRR